MLDQSRLETHSTRVSLLDRVVADVLDAADGDQHAAVQDLVARAERSAKLRKAIVARLGLERLAYEVLKGRFSAMRREALAGNGSDHHDVATQSHGVSGSDQAISATQQAGVSGERFGTTGIDLLKAHVKASLLDFPLQNGRLGDATRDDVLAGADVYLKEGRTKVIRGRWLRSIADRMPEGSNGTVRDLFDEATLASLQEAAEASF